MSSGGPLHFSNQRDGGVLNNFDKNHEVLTNKNNQRTKWRSKGVKIRFDLF